MVSFKNILMTVAILAAFSTPVFSMNNERTSAEEFVDHAMRIGRVVEQSYCHNCNSSFPTAWSFEEKTVISKLSAVHSCKPKYGGGGGGFPGPDPKILEMGSCCTKIEKIDCIGIKKYSIKKYSPTLEDYHKEMKDLIRLNYETIYNETPVFKKTAEEMQRISEENKKISENTKKVLEDCRIERQNKGLEPY